MPHDFEAARKPQGRAARASVSTLVDDRVPGRLMPKFVYAHHPTNWEWAEDAGFVPRCKLIPLRPGVNGCRIGPNGHIPVLNGLRAAGWIVIDEMGPVKVTRDGEIVDDHGYMLQYEGMGGATYADVWSEPIVTGAGKDSKTDWTASYDREGFLAWRIMLRDKGIVPPINPSVLATMLKRQTKRAGRRIVEAHDGAPHIQAEVVVEQQVLEGMAAEAQAAGLKPRKPRKPKARAKNKVQPTPGGSAARGKA